MTIHYTYYFCTFCKMRHLNTHEEYESHLPLRDAKFGIKTITEYSGGPNATDLPKVQTHPL